MKNSQQTLESMSQAIWYNRWTLNKFKKYLKGDILEIGCGIGNFTKSLKDYGNVYAIDININYINEVKKYLDEKAGFGDIEAGKYNFGDKKFDTIVCLNVLEHIYKDQQAFLNLYKLLKDNGHLILLVPAHPFLFGKIDESIGHFRRYKKSDLINNLKEAGFKILSCRRLNFLGAAGWFLFSKLLKAQIVQEKNIKVFNFISPFFLSLENFVEPPIGTSILVIAKR